MSQLHNVLADVPAHDRFTHHWDRDRDGQVAREELSAIDHVLLGPRWRQRLQAAYYIQAHDPLAVTDHFPVVVLLERE